MVSRTFQNKWKITRQGLIKKQYNDGNYNIDAQTPKLTDLIIKTCFFRNAHLRRITGFAFCDADRIVEHSKMIPTFNEIADVCAYYDNFIILQLCK